MPTMVMSQPPKNSGENSQRKRQKSKNDNILAVRCLYVGTDDHFYIYVRERLVYRSNVEVTYEDVYNYLTNHTNDDTISLHYSVNGSYVSITTTGQLHTFLRHVHNDSSTFLYVENQEFVWNVAPQNTSPKMEKRVPADEVAPTDEANGPYDSVDEEEMSHDEGGDGGRVTEEDNSQDDEEYEDEEEEEDDEEEEEEDEDDDDDDDDDDGNRKVKYPVLTDSGAPIVFAKNIPVKETFVEPKLRFATKPICPTADEQQTDPVNQCKKNEDVEPPVSEFPMSNQRWTVNDAYIRIQNFLADAITNKRMCSLPEKISEQLVAVVWNAEFQQNEKILQEAVLLLKSSVGTGILNYFRQIRDRFAPEKMKSSASDSLEKMILSEYTPSNDPELLAEFVDNAIIAACDSLECAQHLAKLDKEFEYFSELHEKHEKRMKSNEKDVSMPTLLEILNHVNSAVVSAHFGFNVLDPIFLGECQCKETILLVSAELQKLQKALLQIQKATSNPQQIFEAKYFVIESMKKIIQRFTDKECPMHSSIEHALRDSEMHKWRKNLTSGYDQWVTLRDNGENLYNVSLDSFETKIERPPPFALKPENAVGDPNVVPIAHNLGDMNSTNNVLNIPTHTIQSRPDNSIESTTKALGDMSTKDTPRTKMTTTAPVASANEVRKDGAVQMTTSMTNASAATTTTTTGQAAGGGAATISKKMSNELQRMVDIMYKNVPNQHNYVYPPPPKPGAILIPTGGLARCRCSKNCPETLMEPAYEYVERFNEPRQTVWEKTKQKRHKKN